MARGEQQDRGYENVLCCTSMQPSKSSSSSTQIEDPGIPLVGRNGGFHLYTDNQNQRPTTPINPWKRTRKYDNVGYRLAKRKGFFHKRKIVCDFALAFALIGIILMMVETELYMAEVYTKDDLPSLLIKSCITISTVTLLGFVVWYHVLDVKLFMCDNSIDDWRITMSWKRVCRILLELLVYAIHPLPGRYDYDYMMYDPEKQENIKVTVPVDAYFSLVMFLRLYLVCRVIMLHSRIYTDASSQSLGALNRIHFNFSFIFKSMMTLYPEYVLLVLTLSVFVITSWMLRACEMYHKTEPQTRDFLNALYLISITFLTVGYGDIVPYTYCGRGIAVLAAIFGALVTALVVAVLARKLELSRAEKYVHNFVIDVELDKKAKVAAANILKAGWLVYRNKKKGKIIQQLKYQRRLLKAIHSIREVKQEQRRMVDSSITYIEMYKAQNRAQDDIQLIYTRQVELDSKVDTLQSNIESVDKKLDRILSAVSERDK